VVVRLAGELDLSTSAELCRRLSQVARTGGGSRIVLDLSDVHFIDAHSVGVIVGAREAAAARGGTLLVAGLRALPARVFSLLGLEPIVKRCDDESGGDPLEERVG
jgi:anti-anti-sigma factor